jgi:hypothetical protein
MIDLYFDQYDKNNIEIFSYNIDSLLIRYCDWEKMGNYISNQQGYLKIDGEYNNGVIWFQWIFSLFDNMNSKIIIWMWIISHEKNISTVQICIPELVNDMSKSLSGYFFKI